MKDGRKFSSWIEAFIQYTQATPTAPIFRKWAAIGALSAVLERKLWTKIGPHVLFPNLFVLFVGKPGSGKTMIFQDVLDIWGYLGKLDIAPASITGAAIFDFLQNVNGKPSIIDAPDNYHSIIVAVDELGILLQSHDMKVLTLLSDLYNCSRSRPLEEQTRGKGRGKSITHPHCVLLAGVQPEMINAVLPESAWRQGFVSRLIMPYTNDVPKLDVFAMPPDRERSFQHLLHDLRILYDTTGEITWRPEAQAAVVQWIQADCPPRPTQPRLSDYCARRWLSCAKVATIRAVDLGEKQIQLEHWEWAKGLLLECEANFDDMFKEITQDSDRVIIEEAFNYLLRVAVSQPDRPIALTRLYNFLQSRVATTRIPYLVSSMENSGVIKVIVQADGLRTVLPLEFKIT